jgi:hypothetical protein
MELLLNLVWLTLALPALWLWRREASRRGSRRFDSWRCLVVLSSLLMLLFPVVSATDDLHAMRPELEESSLSKRMLRPATGHKAQVRLSGADASPVEAGSFSGDPSPAVCGKVWLPPVVLPEPRRPGAPASRAPPSLRLS